MKLQGSDDDDDKDGDSDSWPDDDSESSSDEEMETTLTGRAKWLKVNTPMVKKVKKEKPSEPKQKKEITETKKVRITFNSLSGIRVQAAFCVGSEGQEGNRLRQAEKEGFERTLQPGLGCCPFSSGSNMS